MSAPLRLCTCTCTCTSSLHHMHMHLMSIPHGRRLQVSDDSLAAVSDPGILSAASYNPGQPATAVAYRGSAGGTGRRTSITGYNTALPSHLLKQLRAGTQGAHTHTAPGWFTGGGSMSDTGAPGGPASHSSSRCMQPRSPASEAQCGARCSASQVGLHLRAVHDPMHARFSVRTTRAWPHAQRQRVP